MRTALIAALLCAASLFLRYACAQQGDAVTNQLTVLRAKAEQGEAHSQCELGLAFYSGQFGAAANDVEAVKWFRKAAEQNDPAAQSNLGVCYANGQGVEKDDAEAVKFYREAAERNNAPAQYNLGNTYFRGQGVETDEVEGAKWLRKAAEQNFADAQYKFALCLEFGRGLPKDDVEACRWYLLASGHGVSQAKRNLAMLELRLSREEVAEGRRRAHDWLERQK